MFATSPKSNADTFCLCCLWFHVNRNVRHLSVFHVWILVLDSIRLKIKHFLIKFMFLCFLYLHLHVRHSLVLVCLFHPLPLSCQLRGLWSHSRGEKNYTTPFFFYLTKTFEIKTMNTCLRFFNINKSRNVIFLWEGKPRLIKLEYSIKY